MCGIQFQVWKSVEAKLKAIAEATTTTTAVDCDKCGPICSYGRLNDNLKRRGPDACHTIRWSIPETATAESTCRPDFGFSCGGPHLQVLGCLFGHD